jgi:hypothetical protein
MLYTAAKPIKGMRTYVVQWLGDVSKNQWPVWKGLRRIRTDSERTANGPIQLIQQPKKLSPQPFTTLNKV